MTSPVTITASTGDTCSAVPSTYAAYGVTSATTVSRTGSVTRLRSRTTPAPTAAPAAAPTARMTTGRHTARSSRHGSSSLAAYSSGGSTTRLTVSGGTRTAGTHGSRPTTSPAITSRDGAGIRSRPAKAATTVPSTTRNKTTSTLRTRSVCTGFVAGVAGRLELEGGMLHVEVPGQARLQLVEQTGDAAFGEAGVVDDDVRGQRGRRC